MQVDKLIQGNAYIWVDPHGESRPVKFEGGCLLAGSRLGYVFKVRGYKTNEVRLTEEDVNRLIFKL